MKTAITIGSLGVEPGTTCRGYLDVSTMADGSPLNIPIMVANGANDGPILAVGAGSHGDEYEGMEAVRRVARSIDPKRLSGTFIGVPVINMPGFEAGSRLNPLDSLNLYTLFPGDPQGTASQMVAHVYFTEVISRADYLIDLHNGGDILNLPHSIACIASEDEKTLALAKAFGPDFVGFHSLTGFPTGVAAKKGIPAIQLEFGGEARCRETVVEFDVIGITNVMKTLGMLEEEPAGHVPTMVDFVFLYTKRGGFFLPDPDLSGRFQKGAIIGRVYDIFGDVVETIEAPFDGIVWGLRTVPSVCPGERAFLLVRPR